MIRLLWRFGAPSILAGLFIWWEFPAFAMVWVIVLGVVVGVSGAGSVALYRKWTPALERVTGFAALMVLWGTLGAIAFAMLPCTTPGLRCVATGAGYGAAIGMLIPATAGVVWLSLFPFIAVGRRVAALAARMLHDRKR